MSSSGSLLKALEKMAQVRFLSPLRWEEAALAWWEPGFVASCVERRVHSPSVLGYPQPYSDSGKTALPFTPLGSIALPTRWGFECPFSSPGGQHGLVFDLRAKKQGLTLEHLCFAVRGRRIMSSRPGSATYRAKVPRLNGSIYHPTLSKGIRRRFCKAQDELILQIK